MESNSTNKVMPLNDITIQVKNASTDDVNMVEKTVTKRNGESQPMIPEKIRVRLENLMEGLASKHINLNLILGKTVAYCQNGKTKPRLICTSFHSTFTYLNLCL